MADELDRLTLSSCPEATNFYLTCHTDEKIELTQLESDNRKTRQQGRVPSIGLLGQAHEYVS